MRSLFFGLLAGILAVGPANADGDLHIFNWGGYTNPKLIEKFTQAYGVNVTVDEFSSTDEMLATLRAGNTGYDITVPTTSTVQLLIEEGLLAITEPNRMENFKNVDPRWVDVPWDPGRKYSVPYLWGTTALAVDTAVYGGVVDSLKLLFEPPPELQGKISVVSESGDVIPAALFYLSKPRCTGDPKDLKAVADLLLGAKRYWRSIEYDLDPDMLSGDIALALNWNGSVLRVRQQKPTWKYVYPREGFVGWMDNIVVLKGAPNLENARLFQNFVMDPEIAALNSSSYQFANGILGSEKFLPSEFAEAPEIKIPAGAPALEFVPLCPKDVRDQYDAIWAELTR